jgi:NAD+ kinase
MTIAIYGKSFSSGFDTGIQQLFDRLIKEGIQLLVYKPFIEYLRHEKGLSLSQIEEFSSHGEIKTAQFFISIGGDGTFLESVALVRNSNIPMIGLNTGRLGFLSNIAGNEIDGLIDAILTGNYTTEKRALLELAGQEQLFPDFPFALNEVTIQKAGNSMITIQAYINGDYLNAYWADGLIVSTPTGSTAYSLSAGGPIVTPDAEAFIISPISPHNLTVRPLVVPDNCELVLSAETRDNRLLISMDFQSGEVHGPVQLSIRKAGFGIYMIRLNNSNFYNTLRNKLMWGMDKRN